MISTFVLLVDTLVTVHWSKGSLVWRVTSPNFWMALLRLHTKSCSMFPYLACDSIYAIACYMLFPVRLSVTRVDQSKTVEVRITQLSPQSSPMTLVSWRLASPQNSKGNIWSRGAKCQRGRKISNFQPISRAQFQRSNSVNNNIDNKINNIV